MTDSLSDTILADACDSSQITSQPTQETIEDTTQNLPTKIIMVDDAAKREKLAKLAKSAARRAEKRAKKIEEVEDDDTKVCPICCDLYTVKIRRMIECRACPYRACRVCLEKTILQSASPAECPSCRTLHTDDFMATKFSTTFNKEYREFRKKVLCEQQFSYIPALQEQIRVNKLAKAELIPFYTAMRDEYVCKLLNYNRKTNIYMDLDMHGYKLVSKTAQLYYTEKKYYDSVIDGCESIIKLLTSNELLNVNDYVTFDEVVERVHKITGSARTVNRRNRQAVNRQIANQQDDENLIDTSSDEDNDLGNELRAIEVNVDNENVNTEASNSAGEVKTKPKDKVNINCKCPVDNCMGFVVRWVCGICNSKICSKCREVKLENCVVKSEDHICKPEVIASVKLMQKDSKPCPKCFSLIFRSSGCNQMWCIVCKTGFDWRTGKIYENLTGFHNPEYRLQMAQINNFTYRGAQEEFAPDACREDGLLVARYGYDRDWNTILSITINKLPGIYRDYRGLSNLYKDKNFTNCSISSINFELVDVCIYIIGQADMLLDHIRDIEIRRFALFNYASREAKIRKYLIKTVLHDITVESFKTKLLAHDNLIKNNQIFYRTFVEFALLLENILVGYSEFISYFTKIKKVIVAPAEMQEYAKMICNVCREYNDIFRRLASNNTRAYNVGKEFRIVKVYADGSVHKNKYPADI